MKMGTNTTFGELLRNYRTHTANPRTQRPLSQENMAELLNVAPATVSYWEQNQRQIRADDRRLLLLLIQILAEHGGIRTMAEANALLNAGQYRALSAEESAEWLSKLPGDEPRQHSVTSWRLVLPSSFFSMLFGRDWPEDESRLAALVLHLLGRPADYLTAEGTLRMAGILLLWLSAAVAWSALLSWPYPSSADELRACVIWGSASVILPLLLGFISRADRQAELVERSGSRFAVIIHRIIGAVVGYQVGAAIVLLVTLLLSYLALWPLARWVVVSLAAIPLLISYASARQMPYSYFHAFRQSQGDRAALRLNESDVFVGVVFMALGPALAAFLYFFGQWLRQPIFGAATLSAAAGMIAALEIISRRTGHKVVPPGAFALLLGVPLGSLWLVEPGAEPLFGMGMMAAAIVFAVLTERAQTEINVLQLLALTGMLGGVWGLTELDVRVGRVGLVTTGIICLVWFRKLLLSLAPFWLVFVALSGCLLLIRWTSLPTWAARVIFVACVTGLLIWGIRRRRTQHTHDDSH